MSNMIDTHDTPHLDGHIHHHHTHAIHSHHTNGHHLLQVEHMSVGFERYEETSAGWFKRMQAQHEYTEVIHDLSLAVHEGEIVAVVGASGSGKTLLADAILGICPDNARVVGHIWFDGEICDLKRLSQLRGTEIAFVPQSVDALDPLMKVGKQVELFVRDATPDEAQARRRYIFDRYDLDESVAQLYPFELSGGMARRVLLACALVNNPRLIIADEPTPGLDLELAVKAMEDFRSFANEGGSVLLITHDIELVLRVADRIAVCNDGTVCEETAVSSFESPDLLQHPFSRALWYALPEHEFSMSENAAVSDVMSSDLMSDKLAVDVSDKDKGDQDA